MVGVGQSAEGRETALSGEMCAARTSGSSHAVASCSAPVSRPGRTWRYVTPQTGIRSGAQHVGHRPWTAPSACGLEPPAIRGPRSGPLQRVTAPEAAMPRYPLTVQPIHTDRRTVNNVLHAPIRVLATDRRPPPLHPTRAANGVGASRPSRSSSAAWPPPSASS